MLVYKKARKSFQQFELRSKVLTSLLNNRGAINRPVRLYLSLKMAKQRKKASKVRFKNRCVLSHRARSVYRFARLSRLFLRDPLFIGTLPGLRKSYW